MLVETQTTVPVQLSISLPDFSLSSGKSSNFSATLTFNTDPLVNKTISWSATIGSLSNTNDTTNSVGQATVTYNAPIVTAHTSVEITASFAGDAYYSPANSTSTGIITMVNSLQLEPEADAYISRDNPDENFGNATTLIWQYTGGTVPPDSYRSYIKFNISSIPNSTYIGSAILYLYTTTVPPAPDWTGDSFDVFSVIHDDWIENEITWNNAPPFISTLVDRSGRVSTGAWIGNDVTSFVRDEYDSGNMTASFGIKVNGYDGTYTQANSREGAINQPFLEILPIAIPEFPSDLLMVLIIMTLSTGAVLARKKLLKNQS